MKRISIQALKSGLSAAVAEAEAGQTLLVTRHSRVVARLAPLTPEDDDSTAAAPTMPRRCRR